MFWENYVRLCAEKGQSPTQTAIDLGYSSAMPTRWKNGGIPRRGTLEKIADYFNVTPQDLLNDPAPSKLHREPGEKIAVLASVGAAEAVPAARLDDGGDQAVRSVVIVCTVYINSDATAKNPPGRALSRGILH